MIKYVIAIYFIISLTSIARDFVDSQYSLEFDEAIIMFFIMPSVLVWAVIEKIVRGFKHD